ncbi:MAG: ABC transporter ATP-binding protein [Synechococcales cyanobacterium C42_A2020_086]|jgi:putative spermidine/putrescine transport system ATP-binding protein|nr:ABC transporter ATP-binding protein [Synechococcales cyanobacterium M58_A2018_015]MBF2072847.1 ABC transporter ATP-binding protein [Synechococcales cyanobacterium C42_A2020_086]
MSAVSFRNVSKIYGTSVKALDDVTLDIPTGELVALLGSSGCGKTTLLRCVAGLEQPTTGQVLIDAQDMTHLPARRRPIGMVFQSYALFPNMTVRQNVGFPLKIRQRPQRMIDDRVEELLDLVQLRPQADRYPNQLSGGQQQRASLARSLAASPQVLLLDEPLSALDALVRHQLRDEIRRIQQTLKITTLFVTHDQAEAMAIADRVAVMSHGKIEQLANPYELYEAPATRFSASFIGNRNALELPVSQGRVRLGHALDVPAPDVNGSGRALVFFRPEDVEFSNNGIGHPATVENKIFQGVLTRLYLNLEHEGGLARLYADLPTRQALPLNPGNQVKIYINPNGVRVFAAD